MAIAVASRLQEARMQHPILGVVKGGDDAEVPGDPWAPVMEGFRDALQISAGRHPQHHLLLECFHLTCRLAGRQHLEAALEGAQRHRTSG